ncbi:MAG: caspase family protein [Ramlibacter sp.]
MPYRAALLLLARRAAFAAALVTAAASAQAPADVRVALVIGNSAYPGAALANPARDARDMGQTLTGLGFQVIELRDGGKAQMAQAIAQVRTALKDRKGVGMLYYAGHGLQLDWRNYMVPVDAKLASAADVASQTIDLGDVVDAFKSAGTRMNIVVLDACRDNPFTGSASAKGLAQFDAPTGTFLAYATAPGNVASDGEADGNGLYTRFLLAELRKPTARIEDVFKRVRLQVRQKSDGRQVPWESTSLEEDFFFNTGQKIAKPDERARQAAFELERAEWNRVKETRSAADLFDFLQKFPRSEMAEAAQYKLDRIAKPAVQPAPGKGQSASLAYTGDRYRIGDVYESELKDSLTGLSIQKSRARVTKSTDDVVEFNNGKGPVLTPLGAQIRNMTGTFDPPWGSAPAEFALGKNWEGYSIRTEPAGPRWRLESTNRIVGRETITVPAGSFECWVVETLIFSTPLDKGTAVVNRMKTWIDPRYGWPIRRTEFVRNVNGVLQRTEIRELTSVSAPRN